MIYRSLGALTTAVALALTGVLAGALAAGPASAQERITIGYDGSDAIRPLALALCRAVSDGTTYRCAARRPSTGRPEGPLLSIAYADAVGRDVRAVIPLRIEPVAVLARTDAEVDTFADLAGARVNIGLDGTPGRMIMDALIAANDWTTDTFAIATGLDDRAQTEALCDNQLDAGVAALSALAELQADLDGCPIVPLEIGTEVPGLTPAIVPAGTFANEADVTTLGRSLELVTAAGTDADAVREVTQAIVDRLGTFRDFVAIDAERLAGGVALPLHRGAAQFHQPPPPDEPEASEDDASPDDGTSD